MKQSKLWMTEMFGNQLIVPKTEKPSGVDGYILSKVMGANVRVLSLKDFHIVFESPVWSGFFCLFGTNRNCNRFFNIGNAKKTGLDQQKPVHIGPVFKQFKL